MCSLRRKCHAILVGSAMAYAACFLLSAPMVALAEPGSGELNLPAAAAEAEAWLVTYGPGEIYWQRFGHNAIWLREPALELDHTFNFGYFDFSQENFFTRFLRGRMLYFSLAQPALAEFAMYQRENRGISAQRLDLNAVQYQRLRNHLLEQVRPANREYLYDYYLNNCSTRVRDALDLALDGALFEQFGQHPAGQNFRAHTRRLTSMDFWYYLGLEAGLGSPVDRANSRWEEMFIPAMVSEVLSQVMVDGSRGSRPLVSSTRLVFVADTVAPPPVPPLVWPHYLATGLALAMLAWLAGRHVSRIILKGLVITWVMVTGMAGLVLLGLWTLTDHSAAGANANVLVCNPAFWIAFLPGCRHAAAALFATGTGIALVLAVIPGGQYNLDVLALAVPLNLGCAVWLWRGARDPAPDLAQG